jgi:lysophospholipase L1-like esterase
MRERPDQPAPLRGPKQAQVHEEQEAAHAGLKPKLLLAGDSLAKMWGVAELEALNLTPVAKLAVAGDSTQHVLWRVRNSRVDASEAQATILLAGTNNLTEGDAPEAVLAGLLAIDDELKRRAPNARRVIMHVPPRIQRGHYRDADRMRLNGLIDRAAGERGFLAAPAPDMSPEDERLYKDGLHLFRRTYVLLTQQVARALRQAG